MEKLINFWACATNRSWDMMSAIIGRRNIQGIPARLFDYEMCIQAMSDIPRTVAKTAPKKISPYDIVKAAHPKGNFLLYTVRPKKGAWIDGMIWKITPAEHELVRDWELVDFGMFDDVKCTVLCTNGVRMSAVTVASKKRNIPIQQVVQGDNYLEYLMPKSDIIKVAIRARNEFYQRKRK